MFMCKFCHLEERSPKAMSRHLNSTAHKVNMSKTPGSFKEHKRMQKMVSDAMRGQRMHAPIQRPTPTNRLLPGSSTSSNVSFTQHDSKDGNTYDVFVRGFPTGVDVEALRNYFNTYGQVQNMKMGKTKTFAIIKFASEAEVMNLLKHSHYFMNYRLTVESAVKKNNVDGEDYFQSLVESALEGVSNFDQQVEMLISIVQPDFNVIGNIYNQLCCDLHQILITAFPGCKVHPFGSTVTGLSFKNSDVDVHVSGIRDHTIKNRSKNDLYRAKHVLNMSNMFVNICCISHAKVPIIRCRHRFLNLNVDINFVNMLGVFNSFLVSYYLSLDWKLKPLMILIKYWAKLFKLTGQPHLMKNYTLAIMLIFFLQQEPYNLPSVQTLQHHPAACDMNSGWNVGFLQTLNFNLFHLRNTSLLTLFKGFLAYYTNFNYESHIICPYLGKPVTKDCFKDRIPEGFDLYGRNLARDTPLQVEKPICVQDPFEHTRNVSMVTKYVLDDFVHVCNCTLKKIESIDSEIDLLYKLFTSKYYKLDKVPEFSARFTLAIGKNLNVLQDNTDLKKSRFETIKSFTEVVLRDIFRFTFTSDENNTQKNAGAIGESFEFSCVGHYSLWEGRPKAKIIQKTTGQTILDKEKVISDTLAEKNPVSEQPVIEFQLIVEMKSGPDIATFSLQNFRSYKKAFKTFSLFFMSKFPVWFHEYVKKFNATSIGSCSISS